MTSHLHQHCVHAIEVVLWAALLHRLDVEVGGQSLQDVLSHLTQGLLEALATCRRLTALREKDRVVQLLRFQILNHDMGDVGTRT